MHVLTVMKRIVSRPALGAVALTVGLFAATCGHSQTLLFDFGDAEAQTAPPPVFWSNLTPDQGAIVFGVIDVVNTEGEDTGFDLFVDAVFDASPNTGGSIASSAFPSSATRDSLTGAGSSPVVTFFAENPSDDTFTFTFYASDTVATGNRETRYTVEGSSNTSVDLNPVGNIDNTVSVADVGFTPTGEIITTISAGPNNNGGGTVYLGVLQIESSAGWTAIIDFGGDDARTTVVGGGPVVNWNNITGAVAANDAGILDSVISTDGSASTLGIQMVSRFNGVNASGTTASGVFPSSATMDSLFANTEEFGSLSDLTPIFRITGLDSGTAYDLTFYASRMGVGDNREAVYTLTGSTTVSTSLDAANNVEGVAMVNGIMSDASGEIMVELTPGPNNNNSNHFIYLGVMRLDAITPGGASYLFDWGGDATTDLEVTAGPDSWNNVTGAIGTSETGVLTRLITTDGARTDSTLEIISRFNGVNNSGSTETTVLPVTASRDSLFGNIESFGGLENVLPSFKLTGFDPLSVYDFTFHASRNGVSDVRETRFTLTGTGSSSGDLDASNNVDNTVTVANVLPSASGEIAIVVEPGPNNDNGNHFTYLGSMRIERKRGFVPRILVDFGSTDFMTGAAEDAENAWNNLTQAIGQTEDGLLSDLITADGTPTTVAVQMLARFNGANTAGTQEPSLFPVSVTQDSLFGNTEDWSGLIDVFPSFQLTGLTSGTAYDLTFYGSRNATDNRETIYSVTGSSTAETALNIAGNIDQTAGVNGILPSPDGTITIDITPGPNNSNGNHFTYLGALQVDWVGGPPPSGDISLSDANVTGDTFSFILAGDAGQTYSIQGTTGFDGWSEVQSVQLSGDTAMIEIAITGPMRYFRAVK